MENKIRRSLPIDLHSDEFGYPFNILNDICNHLNGFPCIELNYDNAPKIECMRNLKPVNGHYAVDLLIIDVSKLLMKKGVTYKSIQINDVLENHEEAITLKNRNGERYFISKMAVKPNNRLSSYKENNEKIQLFILEEWYSHKERAWMEFDSRNKKKTQVAIKQEHVQVAFNVSFDLASFKKESITRNMPDGTQNPNYYLLRGNFFFIFILGNN